MWAVPPVYADTPPHRRWLSPVALPSSLVAHTEVCQWDSPWAMPLDVNLLPSLSAWAEEQKLDVLAGARDVQKHNSHNTTASEISASIKIMMFSSPTFSWYVNCRGSRAWQTYGRSMFFIHGLPPSVYATPICVSYCFITISISSYRIFFYYCRITEINQIKQQHIWGFS